LVWIKLFPPPPPLNFNGGLGQAWEKQKLLFPLVVEFRLEMPRVSSKSIWDSQAWKVILAIAVILSIISYLLQITGKVDIWNSLILPIINFFTFPIPLYSVPLAIIIVIAIILIVESTGGSTTVSLGNLPSPARLDILDDDYVRLLAVLCKTPQTTDFLKLKYREFRYRRVASGGYSFEDCLKELEQGELLTYQDGKWTVTQKALDYIDKYHGGKQTT